MNPVIVLPTRKDPPVKNKSFVRFRSKSGNVRGRGVTTLRKARVVAESADGLHRVVESHGERIATALITIKLERGNWFQFKRQCRLLGLTWKVPVKRKPYGERWYTRDRSGNRVELPPTQTTTSHPSAFGGKVEVSGSVVKLALLRRHAFVVGYDNCLDVADPRFSSKGGHWSP